MNNNFSLDKLKNKTIDKSKLDPNNELDAALLKLDDVYQQIQDIEDNIKLLTVKKEQLQDDAEMMEYLLMHKMNKQSRMQDLMK